MKWLFPCLSEALVLLAGKKETEINIENIGIILVECVSSKENFVYIFITGKIIHRNEHWILINPTKKLVIKKKDFRTGKNLGRNPSEITDKNIQNTFHYKLDIKLRQFMEEEHDKAFEQILLANGLPKENVISIVIL